MRLTETTPSSVAALAAAALFFFAPSSARAGGSITVNLDPFASGFSSPLLLTHAGDATGRKFVVEQTGAIRIIDSGGTTLGAAFLDIGPSGLGLTTGGGERGLLGLAFHPNYASNGQFFVSYTANGSGASTVDRYVVSAGDANLADTASRTLVAGPFSQPESNHNGGHIAFGPDGMLFYGLGDGGSGGDPHGPIGNGQNTNTVLGKLLRLDMDSAPDIGLPYHIPADNPFVGMAGFREEIYAWGLRNPWRFSFDRGGANRLFVADVGQGSWEEIDIVQSGDNLGWRCFEGTNNFNPGACGGASVFVDPIQEYDHTMSRCSVTGGYVYRGTDYPPMQGYYFYADYCGGQVYAMEEISPGVWTNAQVASAGFGVTSFGEDEQGELYVVRSGGDILKIAGPVPVEVSGASLE